jgi:hypothetical protein
VDVDQILGTELEKVAVISEQLRFSAALTVGPIGQKALNKVVSYTDATLTLPDATRHYQLLPDAKQTLLDFQIQQFLGQI